MSAVLGGLHLHSKRTSYGRRSLAIYTTHIPAQKDKERDAWLEALEAPTVRTSLAHYTSLHGGTLTAAPRAFTCAKYKKDPEWDS